MISTMSTEGREKELGQDLQASLMYAERIRSPRRTGTFNFWATVCCRNSIPALPQKNSLHKNAVDDRSVISELKILDREVGELREIHTKKEAIKLIKAALDANDFLELRSVLHDIGFDIPAEEPNDIEVPEVFMDLIEEDKIQRFKDNVEWEATREQREREIEEADWLYTNDRYYFGDYESDEAKADRGEFPPATPEQLAAVEEYDRKANSPEERALGKLTLKLMAEASLRSRDKEEIHHMLRMRGFDLDRDYDLEDEFETPDPT